MRKDCLEEAQEIQRGMKMNKPTPSKDCEIDQREKQHALYVDDFGDIKMWKQVCEMFGVPTDEEILPDQIYFNAKDITYGG